jgi:DNA polymerase zeta
MDFDELVSRAPGREKQNSNTDWGYKQTSTIKVIGRHMLNLWRIMRSDQNLRIYTFENVAYHLLRER